MAYRKISLIFAKLLQNDGIKDKFNLSELRWEIRKSKLISRKKEKMKNK